MLFSHGIVSMPLEEDHCKFIPRKHTKEIIRPYNILEHTISHFVRWIKIHFLIVVSMRPRTLLQIQAIEIAIIYIA